MDPVTIIVGALVGAITSGLLEPPIKDGYTSLKRRLKERFGDDEAVLIPLNNIENDPSKWSHALKLALLHHDVAKDEALIAAAEDLTSLLQDNRRVNYANKGDILQDKSRKIIIKKGDYVEGDKHIEDS